MRARTDRQTDRQTDTQTRVTTIHFASSTTHAKCNDIIINEKDYDDNYYYYCYYLYHYHYLLSSIYGAGQSA